MILIKKNKSGQMTIFIILAIVLVAAIILFIIFRGTQRLETIDDKDPESFILSCAENAINNIISNISSQGGDINSDGYANYQGKKITYLCYSSNPYKPCINQRPLLIEHIASEINNHAKTKIEKCFENLKSNLKNKYEITLEEINFSVELKPKQVQVNIKRDLKMRREERVREFNDFSFTMNNEIYDFARIASEITNAQAKFCSFDILGFMVLYPEYDLDIKRPSYSDNSFILYKIKQRGNEKNFFQFAIKSCSMPPGF